MKIHLAGVYTAGRSSPGAGSIHARVTERVLYPHVLESYYYITDKMLRNIRFNKQKIFLDSGAYTAFTQDKKIDLRKYAAFILKNPDVIETAASLDVVGEGSEQQSYDNLKALERLLGDVSIVPTHHARDDDRWLQRYLDEGYQYIALGGMVKESTAALKAWLDHIWHKYLTNPDGTAKVKVHGFGLTTRELMFRYPWYSVDSTSWVLASHYGTVTLSLPRDDGSVKDYDFKFSDRSPQRYELGSMHYSCLKPAEQEVVLARLAELEAVRVRYPDIEAQFQQELGVPLGITPQALAKSYGVRDLANFSYFIGAMDRRVDRFIHQQLTLWD